MLNVEVGGAKPGTRPRTVRHQDEHEERRKQRQRTALHARDGAFSRCRRWLRRKLGNVPGGQTILGARAPLRRSSGSNEPSISKTTSRTVTITMPRRAPQAPSKPATVCRHVNGSAPSTFLPRTPPTHSAGQHVTPNAKPRGSFRTLPVQRRASPPQEGGQAYQTRPDRKGDDALHRSQLEECRVERERRPIIAPPATTPPGPDFKPSRRRRRSSGRSSQCRAL